MAVSIKEIKEKKVWEEFVLTDKNGSFLQSWNWGEFQKAMGEKIFRLGIFDQKKLVGVCLLIKIQARRGIHFICPAGPLIDWKKENQFKVLVEYVKNLAKKEKAVFIRIRPPLEDKKKNKELFEKLGFCPAPMHLHAERTWLLDITPDRKTLLANMRKNTRYLIRKAKRTEIKVLQSQKVKDIEYLYQLQMKTVARHGFVPFSKKHFENVLKAFKDDDQAKLFLAKYKGEIVSAAMIMFYKDQAVYHYAANSLEYPKVPTSYLIIWQAILEAKKRGLKTFNFWGIAPPDKPNHRFAGVTIFKKGFGGEEKVFLHAQDLPLSAWYGVNFIIEEIRKKARHL